MITTNDGGLGPVTHSFPRSYNVDVGPSKKVTTTEPTQYCAIEQKLRVSYTNRFFYALADVRDEPMHAQQSWLYIKLWNKVKCW